LIPFGISYGDVILFRDAGLVTNGDGLHRTHKASVVSSPDLPYPAFLSNNGVTIQVNIPPLGQVQYPVLIFTAAGRELQRLMSVTPNEEYLRALGDFWRTMSNNAKRSTEIKQSEGVVAQVFDQDL
jgi:hypothetical protein